nr:HD domain-containing phosphohydrolase [Alicyclobacillus sacchari]
MKLTSLFESIAFVAEYGDLDADRHVKRVATYARFVGTHVLRLPQATYDRLALAALVHDVGKVAIPREILRKPGPLTPAEREYVQCHTVYGRDMLAHIARVYGTATQNYSNLRNRLPSITTNGGMDAGIPMAYVARIFRLLRASCIL